VDASGATPALLSGSQVSGSQLYRGTIIVLALLCVLCLLAFNTSRRLIVLVRWYQYQRASAPPPRSQSLSDGLVQSYCTEFQR
jgi:hypothetical protein